MANEDMIPVRNGRATYLIPRELGEGEYTITAVYTDESEDYGTHHYASSSTTNTLIITPHALIGLIDDTRLAGAMWNETIQPRVQFTKDGEVFPDEEVTFTLDGTITDDNYITMGTGLTDEEGWAELEEPYRLQQSILPEPSAKPDDDTSNWYSTYSIRMYCRLGSTGSHNVGLTCYNFNIHRRDLLITLDDPGSVGSGAKIPFKGTVYDKLNSADTTMIPGMTIHYLIGATDMDKDVLTGVQFEKEVLPTAYGEEFPISVHVDGNDLYNEGSASNVAIAKQNVVITIKIPDRKYYSIIDSLSEVERSVTVDAEISDGTSPIEIIRGITVKVYDGNTQVWKQEEISSTQSGNASVVIKSNVPDKSTWWASGRNLIIEWSVKDNELYEDVTATANLRHRRCTNATLSIEDDPEYLIAGQPYNIQVYSEDTMGEPCEGLPFTVDVITEEEYLKTQEQPPTSVEGRSLGENTLGKDGTGSITWTPTASYYGKYYLRCTAGCNETNLDYCDLSVGDEINSYYLGDTDKLPITIVSNTQLSVDDMTVLESYEQSNEYLGTAYPDADSLCTIEGKLTRNGSTGLEGAHIYEVYLKYTLDVPDDDGNTDGQEEIYSLKTGVGRDSSGNKISISSDDASQTGWVFTDSKGKFSIPYRVPCGVLNFKNYLKVTVAQDLKDLFYTSAKTDDNNLPVFNVKRYISMEVPSQYLRIKGTCTLVINQAKDSHGWDIDGVRLGLSSEKNRGLVDSSNTIDSGLSSDGGAIVITDYEFPYTRVSVTTETEYCLNAWCNYPEKYICYVVNSDGKTESSDYKVFSSPKKSDDEDGVYFKATPEIDFYMCTNPTDKSPDWVISSSGIVVTEDENVGVRARLKYPWLNPESGGENYHAITGMFIKFSYAGENFVDSIETDGNGFGTYLQWVVPNTRLAYNNRITVVLPRSSMYYDVWDPEFDFSIKRVLVFKQEVKPSMTPNGIFVLDGTVTTSYGFTPEPSDFQVRYVNGTPDLSTETGVGQGFRGASNKAADDIFFTSTSDREHNLKGTFDNNSSETYHMNLSAGRDYCYYPRLRSNTDIYTCNYEWLPFDVIDPEVNDHPMIVNMSTGSYKYSEVTVSAYIENAAGQPIGMTGITVTKTGTSTVLYKDGTSDSSTGFFTATFSLSASDITEKYNYTITVPAQTVKIDGTYYNYEERSGNSYFAVTTQYTITPNTSTQSSNPVVCDDSVDDTGYTYSTSITGAVKDHTGSAVKSTSGFDLRSAYPNKNGNYPIYDGDLSTNSSGNVTGSHNITLMKWFWWCYRLTSDQTSVTAYAESSPVLVYKRHKMVGKVSCKGTCTYNQSYNSGTIQTYHGWTFEVWDVRLGFSSNNVTGTYTHEDSTQTIKQAYDLTKMYFIVLAEYKNKYYLIKNRLQRIATDSQLGTESTTDASPPSGSDASRTRGFSNVNINADTTVPVYLVPYTESNAKNIEFIDEFDNTYVYKDYLSDIKKTSRGSSYPDPAYWDDITLATTDPLNTSRGNATIEQLYDTDIFKVTGTLTLASSNNKRTDL